MRTSEMAADLITFMDGYRKESYSGTDRMRNHRITKIEITKLKAGGTWYARGKIGESLRL